MKSRQLKYMFYETSARNGQNVKEFAKQFGMLIGTYHAHACIIAQAVCTH